MFGFASIRLEVIGYTVNNGDDNNDALIGVLVPFCKYEEIGEILGKVLPDYIPTEKQTKSVSFFPFVSWFYLIVGIITGIVLAGTISVMAVLNTPITTIFGVAFAIFGVAIVVILIKLVSAILSYRINGMALENDKITVYSGGFIKNVTVFKAKHLVAIEDVTTPLRKKRGIASLVMHLKTNETSNEVKVHIQKDTFFGDLEKMLVL